ncbi:MAG: flagellar motor switch protein FliN [Candidatus Kapabacteria bacterium]|nr:flagellar motor switch protein FliN [Candidatus Kapabacteria bacterium]MCS7170166.1 flagellar motor switch protein FliN [Candidatus Kapabacteria bacterium]MDW7996338.1 flagellar motor switch protein FliN [Bacteroidota bacterium]MDW8225022.1 flagellar motor switch protein FliN [Bacteroidota bacterium]
MTEQELTQAQESGFEPTAPEAEPPLETASSGTSPTPEPPETLLHDPKLELLFSIQLPVSVELGRTTMYIRDILRLGRGSVVEFDRLITDPVDVLVNGKKVAEGEVVVIDKHFGIRITTLVEPAERLHGLRK